MKGIVFDLDGVQVNSMPTHFQARKAAVVVENAPLGVRAANNAGISCCLVLNNTPLMRSDFDGLISQDKIFEKTGSLRKVL